MKQFKKGDSEYNKNGYYTIDGIDYMSIGTFKRSYTRIGNGGKSISRFALTNINEINRKESIKLSSLGINSYNSEPDLGDFGDFLEIKIFPVEDLKRFYGVS